MSLQTEAVDDNLGRTRLSRTEMDFTLRAPLPNKIYIYIYIYIYPSWRLQTHSHVPANIQNSPLGHFLTGATTKSCVVRPRSNKAPVDHLETPEDQGPLRAATSASFDDARNLIHKNEIACVELHEIIPHAVSDKARTPEGD